MRRGSKRSKSLPSKFNIDSLLDYLNTSMILNKYELKKLSQQRNLIVYLNNNNNQNQNTNNSSLTLNLSQRLLNRNGSLTKQTLSSGYNSSDNNSTNSTTTTTTTTTTTPNLNNPNIFNFYRLSLNHLNLNNLNCTCTCQSQSINSVIQKNKKNTFKPLSSSPNLTRHDSNQDIIDSEEEEEEDEDEDEDDDDDDDNDDISLDDSIEAEEDEEEDEQVPLNHHHHHHHYHNNNNNHNHKIIEYPKILIENLTEPRAKNFDLTRSRSFRDLNQQKLIYSQNDFIFLEKLGEGFFANVKKIRSKQNNKDMVLKELKLNFNLNKLNDIESLNETINYAELNSAHRSFLKEAQVLRNLNHPNVIRLLGIMFTKEQHLNLILEYISGGTLKDIIHNINIPLTWKLRVGYAKDIASAMQYLHSLNIIHRDLKSDNCLVRENGRSVVVADFGLSRIINLNSNTKSIKHSIHTTSTTTTTIATTTTTTTNSNTTINNNSSLFLNDSSSSNSFLRLIAASNLVPHSPESSSSATNSFIVAAKRKLKKRTDTNTHRKQRYAVVGNSFSMAPEMLKHEIYDERVDIFSFGIICCEIIGRVQADPDYLPRTSDFGLNVELFRKKYCEPDCPKQFIKIAIACCELEPEKRPPFSKSHLWLDTILAHLEANNPIPKNLLKNILDSNNLKRPSLSLNTNDYLNIK